MANQQIAPTNNRRKVFSLVLQWFIIIGLWANILLYNWRSLPFTVAWNISDRKMGRMDVRAITVDSHGDPWFISQRQFSDDKYEIRHVAQGRTDSWNLPALSFEERQFAGIALDDADNPWLILGKRLAHWDGSQWVFIPTPFEADINSFICPSIIVNDSMVWGIDSTANQNRLIQLDLSQKPIETQEILLPPELASKQYGFHCIAESKDDLVVVLSNKEQVDFYQLQNLEWQKITGFSREQVPYWSVNDIEIDSKNQIWVSLMASLNDKHVGKFDPTTNSWTWFNLERQPGLEDRIFDFSHIAVDGFGRVWISATQFRTTESIISSSDYEAGTIGVFEEKGDTLVEIRHYTSRNSSLETSGVAKIINGPDGKLWTWSRQLVWMDGSQQELPHPLPDWFVSLTTFDASILYNIFLALLLVVQVIVQAPFLKQKFHR